MKTKLEQIQAELREIIALSDKAMKGPWYYWDEENNDYIANGKDKGKLICALAGMRSRKPEFKFIAASRAVTPKAARALLTAIEGLEDYAKGSMYGDTEAGRALETICREWEEPE